MAKKENFTSDEKRNIIQKAFDYITPDHVLEYEKEQEALTAEKAEQDAELDDMIEKLEITEEESKKHGIDKETEQWVDEFENDKTKGNLDKDILDIVEKSGFEPKYPKN